MTTYVGIDETAIATDLALSAWHLRRLRDDTQASVEDRTTSWSWVMDPTYDASRCWSTPSDVGRIVPIAVVLDRWSTVLHVRMRYLLDETGASGLVGTGAQARLRRGAAIGAWVSLTVTSTALTADLELEVAGSGQVGLVELEVLCSRGSTSVSVDIYNLSRADQALTHVSYGLPTGQTHYELDMAWSAASGDVQRAIHHVPYIDAPGGSHRLLSLYPHVVDGSSRWPAGAGKLVTGTMYRQPEIRILSLTGWCEGTETPQQLLPPAIGAGQSAVAIGLAVPAVTAAQVYSARGRVHGVGPVYAPTGGVGVTVDATSDIAEGLITRDADAEGVQVWILAVSTVREGATVEYEAILTEIGGSSETVTREIEIVSTPAVTYTDATSSQDATLLAYHAQSVLLGDWGAGDTGLPGDTSRVVPILLGTVPYPGAVGTTHTVRVACAPDAPGSHRVLGVLLVDVVTT